MGIADYLKSIVRGQSPVLSPTVNQAPVSGPSPTNVPGSQGSTTRGTVAPGGGLIYSQPGAGWVLATLPAGTPVTVLGNVNDYHTPGAHPVTQMVNSVTWIAVAFPQQGWIRVDSLVFSFHMVPQQGPPQSPPPGGYASPPRAGTLMQRSAIFPHDPRSFPPGTENNQSPGTLQAGTKLQWLGYEGTFQGHKWSQVQVINGVIAMQGPPGIPGDTVQVTGLSGWLWDGYVQWDTTSGLARFA